MNGSNRAGSQRNPVRITILMTGCLLATGVQAQQHTGAAAPTVLETVEVRAQQLQLDLLRENALIPGGVSLIDSELLYQRNVANLADMLRYAPGIWSNSTSGGSGVFLSSRGSNLDATDYDMNGIKLMQDGLPISTADGNNHNRLIDPLSTRYATIARGANALTWGASTLGGAINFVSPTALNSEPVDLFLNGGSHGRITARATGAQVFDNGLDGLVTVERNHWDGYRDHSREKREGVYANTGWQFSGNSETRLYASYLDSDQKLPGALTEQQYKDDPDQASSNAQGGNFQKNVNSWRVASRTHWSLGDNESLVFGVSWEEQSLYHPIVDKVLVDFDGPGPMSPTEVFSLLIDTDHRDFGATARYETSVGAHDLLLGLNYGDGKVHGGNYRNDNGQKNGLTTRVDNKAQNTEVFAMDRWGISEQWTLVYGVQGVWADRNVENIDVETGLRRNPSDDYSSLNPRVGVLYEFSDDITLFANVSKLFEAPTNFELQDDVRDNDDTLDAMKGAVLEIGARGTQSLGAVGEWYWDVAVYYAQIDNEILSVDDPLEPGTSLSTNIDNTIHAGVESLFGASFTLDAAGVHRLDPTISLTLNDFSFDNDQYYGNNDLPAAPDYALRGELLYRHANGFYVGPTFDLIDSRYADFSNTYKVDSYGLLGFRGGFNAQRWEVFAEVTNLLDKNYVSTMTVKDYAAADADILYPGAPVSFYAGIRFQL
ncbi:Hemin receptor [Halioglobus japonicus]|nr:Hemin receptor [Halioglobus japonicus]